MKDASKRFFDIAGSHPNALLRAAVDYQPPPPTHYIRRPRNVLFDPPDALAAAVDSLNDVNDTHDCLRIGQSVFATALHPLPPHVLYMRLPPSNLHQTFKKSQVSLLDMLDFATYRGTRLDDVNPRFCPCRLGERGRFNAVPATREPESRVTSRAARDAAYVTPRGTTAGRRACAFASAARAPATDVMGHDDGHAVVSYFGVAPIWSTPADSARRRRPPPRPPAPLGRLKLQNNRCFTKCLQALNCVGVHYEENALVKEQAQSIILQWRRYTTRGRRRHQARGRRRSPTSPTPSAATVILYESLKTFKTFKKASQMRVNQRAL
ncbi:hypothetical protein EVAR_92708_1 [Eumeta japonica]|uniref:Uncharacterized protein n=1 Tax=Eumeta variegata TaxID=151549 RepID=A0A4C1T0J6_EUMVA|nr:hypothetical protein EVAR_92708_1 [Eumeta japonica]